MAIALQYIPDAQKSKVQLDSQGEINYPHDWSALLTRHSATLASVQTALSAEAIAAGFEIISQTHDTTRSVVRFGIAADNEGDVAFDPPDGLWCRYKQIATLSTTEIVAESFAVQVVRQ